MAESRTQSSASACLTTKYPSLGPRCSDERRRKTPTPSQPNRNVRHVSIGLCDHYRVCIAIDFFEAKEKKKKATAANVVLPMAFARKVRIMRAEISLMRVKEPGRCMVCIYLYLRARLKSKTSSDVSKQ